VALSQLNWLGECPPEGTLRLGIKTRYRSPSVMADVHLDGHRTMVHYEQAQARVAPGQAAVFYRGERVVGGGVVCSDQGASLLHHPTRPQPVSR
jgi:tRNA-specific 2-thiouridylase